MKRMAFLIFSVVIILGVSAPRVYAVDQSKSYNFSLTVNGEIGLEVTGGEVIIVDLILTQTSPGGEMAMYALDGCLRYNNKFFAPVPGSITADGVEFNIQNLTGTWSGWSELVFGAWSAAAEGSRWENPKKLLTVQFTTLKVGASTIMQRGAAMYITNGLDTYDCTANDVTVIIKAVTTGAEPGLPRESEDAVPGDATDDRPGGNTGDPGAGTSGGGERSGVSAAGSNTEIPSPVPPAGRDFAIPEKKNKNEKAPHGSPPAGTAAKAAALFNDVPAGAWYTEAVGYAVEAGIFKGTGDAAFSPHTDMTRAMAVTVLYSLEGSPAATGTNTFADVANGQWYSDAVLWANANNITRGYGNGRFGTGDNITREQLATVLYRYAAMKGYDLSAALDPCGYILTGERFRTGPCRPSGGRRATKSSLVPAVRLFHRMNRQPALRRQPC